MQTILCEILVGVYFVNWSFGGVCMRDECFAI